MAPKKMRTKEEIEAERLRAEEEAKKAEEDRIEEALEAAKRREEEELRKEQLHNTQLANEAERLETEREQLSEHNRSCKQACSTHAKQADDKLAWNRYTACSALPDPCKTSSISDYLSVQSGAVLESIPDALSRVCDALTIIDEASSAESRSAQRGHTDEVTRLNRCRLDLYSLITHQVDAATAWFLHHCDRFADSEGNIKHEETTSRCRWTIWLNINKNPRLKSIEFPAAGLQLEIQKQLALAPIAIRAQVIDAADEYLSECANEWYAVGDVIKIDLIALPPMCKATVNSWTLRVHGPLTKRLHQLPYPIPPAVVDPATWQSEEDVHPLGIITDLRPSVVLLADTNLQVGMWDAKDKCWSNSKVSHVALNDGQLAFKVTALAPCAVMCSRTALLPYASWSVRPSAGDGGDRALLSVDIGINGMPLDFEVAPGSVSLRGPLLAPLVHLLGVSMQPMELLSEMKRVGMFLMPGKRDASFAAVVVKDEAVERVMCADVASLAASHLIASSKWSQYVRADECICRLSEVLDWDMGGRTSAADVHRIFVKELEAGPTKVTTVLRTGTNGVAFCTALNRCAAYPELPEYSDDRRGTCIWGEPHASLLALIRANFAAELTDEVVVNIAAREEEEGKRRSAEAKRLTELEEIAKKGEKAPEELLAPISIKAPKRPLYWPTNWPQVAEELKPAEGTVARALAFSPLASETLAQLMFALRLFSFSAG